MTKRSCLRWMHHDASSAVRHSVEKCVGDSVWMELLDLRISDVRAVFRSEIDRACSEDHDD